MWGRSLSHLSPARKLGPNTRLLNLFRKASEGVYTFNTKVVSAPPIKNRGFLQTSIVVS